MTEKTFVGSKYLETLEWGTLDLAKIITDDLNLSAKNKELPKGNYNVVPFRTNEGDLLKVFANLDDYYEMSRDKINETYQDIKDIVNEYNRVKHVESFLEKDRRFYNENIYLN